MNDAVLEVPEGLVTVTLTLVPEPEGTTAVISVAEFTVNEVAAVPPNKTAVAPVKLVPVMVTEAPTAAVAGLSRAMFGVE